MSAGGIVAIVVVLVVGAMVAISEINEATESPQDREAKQQARAARDFELDAVWRLEQASRKPDSVETRNVHTGSGVYAGSRVVCGEFKGENAFGGMTFFQRFVMINGKVPLIEKSSGDDETFDKIWNEAGC